jgi:addiction module RelE/StbE family toxin
MKIIFSPRFQKNFGLLSHGEQKMVREQLDLFVTDYANPSLKDHALEDRLSIYRSFSIHDDLRVLYRIVSAECIKLIDVGPHSKVYKR